MLGGLRRLWDLANAFGFIYRDAVFFAMRVALDERAARRWLPPGMKLAMPATATVFAAHFPHTTFGSVYDEAGVFFHVRRRFRDAVFCPWMVVTDDVALIVGRELLGYPKKLARIDFSFGTGAEGSEVTARVERRGRELLRLRGRVGERVLEAPPMLGQRALNVRGSLGPSSQRLVTFTPRERVAMVSRATAELTIADPGKLTHGEEGRDPLSELGLGNVLSAHLYRVDVGAGMPPREVRGAGMAFAMKGLGARWL